LNNEVAKEPKERLVMEELMQAALAAPEDRRTAALRILRGEAELASAPVAVAPGEVGPERYVTLKACAERLGVSACSLWRWGVPGHSLGGRRRFRVSEVAAYLESEEFKVRAEELKQERGGGERAEG
jgi:hypothetical protein